VPPELSVVIPSHNRPDLLRACLASVARHAPAGTEVVVVDDGSPGEVVTRTASEFRGVRCVRLARRRGFCAAANAGVGAARGSVVELLNDDAEATAGWAEAALGHFADGAVAAVAPLVLCWPGEPPCRIDSAGDRYYVGGVAGKRGHGERLGPAHLHPRPVFGASASSAFYRREALVRAGAFPEAFGAYFEDVDLSFRLRRAGGRVMFEPASRVLHRVSASYGKPRRRLLEQQSRNEELVFWRNIPTRALVRALPRHLGILAGKAWLRWREGQVLPFVMGRLRALAEWRAVAGHRRWLLTLGPDAEVESWGVEARMWSSKNRAA
jgi:GT2 family glycosyltransferase